jgi:glutaredoxin-like YruB-family protein
MKTVEIYTSDTCIQCVKAKEYLKNKNIEFKEYNISNDLEAKRELIRMGYMSIPVLIIDGEHVLGFDLNRIESLLQK